jgi:hypothetical protein
MSKAFTYTLKRSCFDENYNPSENTRTTTNFANLARGEKRQENLRNTLVMINNRFNALARWDNPNADRYAVELEIISVDLNIGADKPFPAIEILQTTIVDKKNNLRIPGLSAITFRLTCGIMISAFCCWNITRTNSTSAFRKSLVNCTATYSAIL